MHVRDGIIILQRSRANRVLWFRTQGYVIAPCIEVGQPSFHPTRPLSSSACVASLVARAAQSGAM
uniref:Uncharacterized protein n=1 Tax=Utricularia reniformis TaxID=192314 RepID=A0A1Y0AZ20_9LAMI|nr:hypothetical protein AEK19_MT1699 [Utricularia reniformis]ART30398.1 hypothetical protein AEK19_MT1699 [Utricularia reniformis]